MVHNHNKIIMNLMIKNESKIIERCIERALDHVDAISILDTGSTDNTVEICNKFLEKCGKPFNVSVEQYKKDNYEISNSYESFISESKDGRPKLYNELVKPLKDLYNKSDDETKETLKNLSNKLFENPKKKKFPAITS